MFMIIYLVLNLPWMYLSTINATTTQSQRRRYGQCLERRECPANHHRKIAMGGFLLMLPPLIWLYYRHSVLRVPGGKYMMTHSIQSLTSSLHALRLLRMVTSDLGHCL